MCVDLSRGTTWLHLDTEDCAEPDMHNHHILQGARPISTSQVTCRCTLAFSQADRSHEVIAKKEALLEQFVRLDGIGKTRRVYSNAVLIMQSEVI